MRVAVIAGYAPSLLNFRRELLRELRRNGHDVVAMAPEDDAVVRRELARDGVAFHSFPLVRNAITPARDLHTVGFLARFFRRHRVKVVFSYTIKPVVFGSIAAAMAGVPHISAMVTGLGYAFTEVTGPKRQFVRKVAETLYRQGLSHCQNIVFQNADDRGEFERRRLLPATARVTIVNGSGVDVQHHRPQPISDGPPHFLMIARLLREKGIREFGAAADIVKASVPSATFEVVGPDDESPGGLSRIEKQAAEKAGVGFSGPTRDVRVALKRCTVFVLPSYREGTPRTVLEAMAAQRPIVTTDVPGCRQTTVHEQTGLLVPPQDPQALAAAMLRLASNPGLAQRYATAARRRVERIYDVRDVAASTADAILGQVGDGIGGAA